MFNFKIFFAVGTAIAAFTNIFAPSVAWAGPATHFSISAPGFTTAGVGFNFTVTALDAGNAIDTGYSGSVHFTSSDGGPSLPADYTFVAGDSGVHTFSGTLITAGLRTITATDLTSAQ